MLQSIVSILLLISNSCSPLSIFCRPYQEHQLPLVSPSVSYSTAFFFLVLCQVSSTCSSFAFFFNFLFPVCRNAIFHLSASSFLISTASCLLAKIRWSICSENLRLLFHSFVSFSYQRKLRVFLWGLSDSKSLQVPRTLLSIQPNFNNAVLGMVSTRPVITESSILVPILCWLYQEHQLQYISPITISITVYD